MKEIFETTDCLNFDQIKLYVQGQLNAKDRYKVEEHLSDCELCGDALEGYASSENMETAETLLKKIKWPVVDSADDSEKGKVIPIKQKPGIGLSLMKVAAILIGVVGSFVAFSLMTSDNSSIDRTIASSYPVYDISKRNDSTTQQAEPFYKALQLYDRKEYKESASLLSEYLLDNPQDKAAIFFHGVALLKSGQTNKAISKLEKVYLDRTSGYYLDATWFLALAKMKKGNKRQAKSLLMTLSQTGNYYNKRASDLLITL